MSVTRHVLWVTAGTAAASLLVGFYAVVDSSVDRAKARQSRQLAEASCAWKQPDASELCKVTVAADPAPGARALTTRFVRQAVAVAGAAN